MHGLFHCPPFVRFICGRMWCRRVLPTTLPAPLSATLSPALWVYLCKCGAAGSASARLPAPFVPHSASLSPATATRVLSTPGPVSAPPTSLDECLFSISLVLVPLAVRFSCQVWLCEEAQCVYQNQDGGIGRHTAPPRTTRTDRESNSKGDQHQGNRK